MCQNVLGVLQPLGHFGVVTIESLVERHGTPLTFLVDVGHVPVLRVEQNLGMILEVNLYNLITEPKHNSMLRPHPLLNINRPWLSLLAPRIHLISLQQLFFLLWIIILLEVRLEVLQ